MYEPLQRTEAEAANIRIQSTTNKKKKKEIELRKRQDKIKAEFKLLHVKREAEDAVSYIGVYEEEHLSNFRRQRLTQG